MCLYLVIILSVVLGFVIAQATKIFNLLVNYGGIFQDFKIGIAYSEAKKNKEGYWCLRSFAGIRALSLSQAQDEAAEIYNIISNYSKRMKLYDCIYCISIRVSSYVVPVALIIGLSYCFCPAWLLFILLIPIFTYTFDEL